MQNFNSVAKDISPEQSRAAFKAARQKTMVEQQQIVPVLKPHGMGESEVDRIAYRTQLQNEHKQAQAVNLRAQQLYQMRVSEIHSRVMEQGKEVSYRVDRSYNAIERQGRTVNNFNQHAAQAWDMQEISR